MELRPRNTWNITLIILMIFAVAVISYSSYVVRESYLVRIGIEEGFNKLMTQYKFSTFSCGFFNYSEDQTMRKITPFTEPVKEKYAPDNLIKITGRYANAPDASGIYVHKQAYPYLISWLDKAIENGYDMRVNSGFRTYGMQRDLLLEHVVLNDHEEEKAARPGNSEHQLGTAVDISLFNPLSKTKLSEGYSFLARTAYLYGFIQSYPLNTEEVTGYRHEPWHYRYVGTRLALKHKKEKSLYNEQNKLFELSLGKSGELVSYNFSGTFYETYAWFENFNVTHGVVSYSSSYRRADIMKLGEFFDEGLVASGTKEIELLNTKWELAQKATKLVVRGKSYLETVFLRITQERSDVLSVLYDLSTGVYTAVIHDSISQKEEVSKETIALCW